MLKSSILLLLIFTLSCSRKTETLLSKWESKSSEESLVERKLASDANKCLKDVYSVDLLKSQIADLEKPFADSNPVRGKWKGIDLSTLPVPQANFLKSFGSKIGNLSQPNSISYEGCQSLPCVFNRIYGRGDDLPGYVHYIWYLKFGHMLSADNHVPNQLGALPGQYNGKEISFDKYLYSDQELYAFWRLSLMLESPYTTLAEMREIQRIPRGEAFEGDYKKACGLAHSTGWIILTDSPLVDKPVNLNPNMIYTYYHCLSLENDIDKGYMYSAVTHELGHQIDFSESDKYGTFAYRSHRPDYLKFTGMSLQESVVGGVMRRNWVLDPKAKLISSYAGTAPQENFAESLAYFRIDGEKTKSGISDEHFAFVSQNYYQGRSYTNSELVKSWHERFAKDFAVESFRIVKECSASTVAATSNYFSAQEFSEPLPVSFLQCLGSYAESYSQSLRAKVVISEPQGCSVLAVPDSKRLWDVSFRKNMISAISKNLENLKTDSDYFSKVAKAYELLKSDSYSREAFFSCSDDSNPATCYEAALREKFQSQVSGIKPDDLKEITYLYMEKYSYQSVSGEIKRSYMNLVSSFEENIRSEAASLWKSCKSIPPNDVQPPTGDFFSVGGGYIVSSIYNCVNSQYDKNIKNLLQIISIDGRSASDPKELNFLNQVVKESFKARLKQLYEFDSMEEERRSTAIVEKESEALLVSMKSDLSWLNGKPDIMKACEEFAMSRMELNTIFSLKKDFLPPLLANGLCLRLSQDPLISNFSADQKKKAKDTLFKGLSESYYQALAKRGNECLEKYPKDTKAKFLLYKIQRGVCVNSGWESIESDLAYEKARSPEAKSLGYSALQLEQILYNNRPTFKKRISLEYLQP